MSLGIALSLWPQALLGCYELASMSALWGHPSTPWFATGCTTFYISFQCICSTQGWLQTIEAAHLKKPLAPGTLSIAGSTAHVWSLCKVWGMCCKHCDTLAVCSRLMAKHLKHKMLAVSSIGPSMHGYTVRIELTRIFKQMQLPSHEGPATPVADVCGRGALRTTSV